MAVEDPKQWTTLALQLCERDVGFRQWLFGRLLVIRAQNPHIRHATDEQLLNHPHPQELCTLAERLLQIYTQHHAFTNEGPTTLH